jgi:hypothetical protein
LKGRRIMTRARKFSLAGALAVCFLGSAAVGYTGTRTQSSGDDLDCGGIVRVCEVCPNGSERCCNHNNFTLCRRVDDNDTVVCACEVVEDCEGPPCTGS